MNTFKVKDLMIQLPEEGVRREAAFCAITKCPVVTVIQCPPGTFYPWVGCRPITCPLNTCQCFSCPHTSVIPEAPTIIETVVEMIRQTGTIKGYVEQGGDLAALQAQMRQALESVDEAVRARDEALAPKTVEEIDRLEEQLKAALDDLKERKANLKK